MAGVRAAGSHSGSNGCFLESSKPFSGIVQDMLHRQPPAKERPSAQTTGNVTAQNFEVLTWAASPNHNAGGIPRHGGKFAQVAIPGYKGHITGKVSENAHGQTFGAENERATQMQPLRQMRRTTSAPEQICAPGAAGTRGLAAAPRVPGYAGHIPGKHAETVHGLRFSEASEAAASLREVNPHISCDGWLRRGEWPVDRMATYKWSNRFSRADTQALFSPEQEEDAFESNKRLGQSFGLKAPKVMPLRPGDRFLHCHHKKPPADSKAHAPKSPAEAAGRQSISIQLDHERGIDHRALGLHKHI